jgi:hypothetical protein
VRIVVSIVRMMMEYAFATSVGWTGTQCKLKVGREMTESQERLIYEWLGYGPDENDIFPDRPLLDYNTFMGEVVPKLTAEECDVKYANGHWDLQPMRESWHGPYWARTDPWLAVAEYLGREQ